VSFVGSILEWLFNFTSSLGHPSYLLAIVVLTVAIKIVLLPLNIKQMKSTKNMQLVQPQLKELQKKYANNPQKQQQEMMKLYKEHNVSPMAGCLPLLIQLPIIMILYRGLLNFVPAHPEAYYTIGGLSLGEPSPNLILPFIVALATFGQSFVGMGKPTEAVQKYMLVGMPIFLGYMATKFQAGICVYWITFSILGMLQQIVVNKGFTPQQGAARKEAKEAAKKALEAENIEEAPSPNKGIKNPNTSKKKK
jgi:YidC/Oxa1 family membrane protein insertase